MRLSREKTQKKETISDKSISVVLITICCNLIRRPAKRTLNLINYSRVCESLEEAEMQQLQQMCTQ